MPTREPAATKLPEGFNPPDWLIDAWRADPAVPVRVDDDGTVSIRPTDDMLRTVLDGARPDWWLHGNLEGEPPQWWAAAMFADQSVLVLKQIAEACGVSERRPKNWRAEHLATGEVGRNALPPPDKPMGPVAEYGKTRDKNTAGQAVREGYPGWSAGYIRGWARHKDVARMDEWFRGVIPPRSGRPAVLSDDYAPARRVA
ncbi:MAG: hypothetical protein EPO06_11870 [Burkholderiaceae bacterium]|nr:MAG: hypothetical protein EPO06_11870 [Burkholderiaceae bacterium]